MHYILLKRNFLTDLNRVYTYQSMHSFEILTVDMNYVCRILFSFQYV